MLLGSVSAAENGGSIVANTDDFWKLVPKDAKIEKVAGGFQFTEGPVWHKDGYLLFSDCHANGIMKWDPSTCAASLYRAVAGFSNGLTFDKIGRLIAVEYGMHRITRQEKDGSISELVSQYEGKRLNSTNDLAVKSDGSIYFTDPPYGVKPEDRELDFCAVYRFSPYGKLTLLTRDMEAPNGLAFSPDEKVLYVADSSRRSHIQAFDVRPDGTLANMRLFATLKAKDPGVPDGLKVDTQGNVWSTGPGGVWVFDKTGKHLGTIKTPEVPANCAWGDADGKALYITARTSVYRIKTNAVGIRAWMRRE
jgi:sugar lactone lactonase YvrE